MSLRRRTNRVAAAVRRWNGWGGPILCCASALALGCARDGASDEASTTATARQAVESAPLALSGAAKQAMILDVLEKFVPFAEKFWTTSDISEANTGRYNAVGSGVTQPRGAGDIAFAYVTLFEAFPDRESFGGVSRAVLLDHTIQSIRHEAYTNALSGKNYKKWGGGTWQASLETFSWAFAARKLWDKLDDDTRAIVKKVLLGEANILLTKALASGEEGDTGAEDNAWNSPTPALARVMFPEEANASAWDIAAKRLAINASSTTADASDSTTLVDGKALNEWMGSVNLHPDLTMENHGFFNPIYQQVTHVDINDAAIAYAEAGEAVPQAFSFRTEAIWDNVLGRLLTDEGDFAMPAGQDWISKDFQHLDYLGILATRFQRADASVAESRALTLVAQRQATHASGSMLGQSQVGYETMLIKRLAALWWTHELFGTSPVPTSDALTAARKATAGVKVYPYSAFVGGRLGKAFVSMSWDPSKPMGLVVPNSDAFASDPLFAYYAPNSLLGSASGTVGAYGLTSDANSFSTAGTVGARRFSMTAFPDGVTVLLDRGTGSTFTYATESINGLTGARSVWSDSGEASGTLSGNWVNVADRFGMIVRGGAGISAALVTGTNNQLVITGSTATGSGNRGAIILPNVVHSTTQTLEPYAVQPVVPDDWAALAARADDGTVRVAMARWAGAATATIALSDERGAPVTEEDSTTEGDQSRFVAQLSLLASRGQTIRYFVDSKSSLRVQQDGDDAAVIRNPNAKDASVTVTHVNEAGKEETTTRVIAANEEVFARVVDGAVTLAGPELESLVQAKDSLTELKTQLSSIEPDGCHRGGHGHGYGHGCGCGRPDVSEFAGDALDAVSAAIAQSRAEEPNERALAFSIERARRLVERLELFVHDPFLPRAEREAIKKAIVSAKDSLREAATIGHTVSSWMVAENVALPGEPLKVRLSIVNDGERLVRSGTVTLRGPDGWTAVGPVKAFRGLRPGESISLNLSIPVPATAKIGEAALLTAEVDFDRGCHEGATTADLSATVAPVIDLRLGTAKLPLALGGANLVPVTLNNFADHEIEVSLLATGTDGLLFDATNPTFTIPAQSQVSYNLVTRTSTLATGSGTLNLVARTANGAEQSSSVAVSFSDDLALNTVGSPFPVLTATSSQSAYQPALANDSNGSTFWVSGGTVSGQGPTPSNPIWLMADLGTTQSIGSVTMVPRVNYGPKAYTIEVSDDASTWVQVGSVPSASNATITTAITPVKARYLRLVMTASWDKIQPPRNVQISSLIVKAAL